MSAKNTLVTTLVTGQSLSASFNSAPTVVRYLDNCSYQINISTTDSVGTFAVQVSNDFYVQETTGDVANAGNWITLTLAGGAPTVAAANDFITINLNQLPFYAVRLAYTATTAGTGTCSIYITDKRLG